MSTITPLPNRRPAQEKMYPVCSFKKAMSIIESKCGDVSITERHGKGENKVILLPEATSELEVMISYGRRSPMNVNEQKYTGYGHFLIDERGHVTVIVKHFIEIQTMNRNPVGASNLGPNGEYNPGLDFLEYHREEFLRTEAKYNTDAFGYPVDPFLKTCGPSEFVMEGHTHPDLGVFYSHTDKVSGSARAAKLPICIFVCDPIRREMLGSIGRNLEGAEVIVYSRNRSDRKDFGPELPLKAEPIPRPNEKTGENIEPISLLDELGKIANQCIRSCGYEGYSRVRTRRNDKVCLKIKLFGRKGRR